MHNKNKQEHNLLQILPKHVDWTSETRDAGRALCCDVHS